MLARTLLLASVTAWGLAAPTFRGTVDSVAVGSLERHWNETAVSGAVPALSKRQIRRITPGQLFTTCFDTSIWLVPSVTTRERVGAVLDPALIIPIGTQIAENWLYHPWRIGVANRDLVGGTMTTGTATMLGTSVAYVIDTFAGQAGGPDDLIGMEVFMPVIKAALRTMSEQAKSFIRFDLVDVGADMVMANILLYITI